MKSSENNTRRQAAVRSRTVEERIAEAVRCIGSHDSIVAELGVSRSTANQLRGGRSRSGRLPRALTHPRFDVLRAICDTTGTSADWILGFDVPADRDARADIGMFARHLHRALLEQAPQFAPVEIIGTEEDASEHAGWSRDVVRGVVSAWWEGERRRLAADYGRALRQLSIRLEADADSVDDARLATHMRLVSREQRREATLVASSEATWRELSRLRAGPLIADVPGSFRASRSRSRQPAHLYVVDVSAVAGRLGAGVAWPAPDGVDRVWFIDAADRSVAYLEGRSLIRKMRAEDAFAR